ncbi:MAG: type II CAAX prenyl endopeptidase Rce1 family protein [Candidatus Thorarchaeota archaeon]
MKVIKKYILISSLVILLVIPIFFGVFNQYLLLSQINLIDITYLVIGMIVLLLIGFLISTFVYDTKSLELMKNHDVINSLIRRNNRLVLVLFFPLTMIMEELIFRYYILGLFMIELKFETLLAVLLSSLIFSVYHIHFWFKFKNLRITTTYIIYSFLLGLFTAYILITFNIFISIFAHYIIAFAIYFLLFKKKYKNEI